MSVLTFYLLLSLFVGGLAINPSGRLECQAVEAGGLELREQLDGKTLKDVEDAGKNASSYEKLERYLKSLDLLRDRWRKAARIAWEGDIEGGRAVLEGDLPVSEGYRWQWVTKSHSKKLALFNRRWEPVYLQLLSSMDSPELAVREVDVAEKKDGRSASGQGLRLSQCLIEIGEYERAREVLVGLFERNLDSTWRDIVKARVEAIKGLGDGEKPAVESYRTIYLQEGWRWYDGQLGPILTIWESGRDNKNLQLIAALFSKAHDQYGQSLALELIAEQAERGGDRKEAAAALLKVANMAYKAKEYDKAYR
ncbi:MAG: hypothetical protein ACYS21_04690, partial [Planctomycetota bacterium]